MPTRIVCLVAAKRIWLGDIAESGEVFDRRFGVFQMRGSCLLRFVWYPRVIAFPYVCSLADELTIASAVRLVIQRIGIAGYRSIRSLNVYLGELNLITGPNGFGKTNLYCLLRLIAAAGSGGLSRSLASEGDFGSVLWAGPESISNEMKRAEQPILGTLRSKPIALKLGVLADRLSYCIDLGRPTTLRRCFMVTA